MFFLLPLIVFVAAQQCPYCRWNACTLTEGSLASCSDCYLGTLINFQLNEPGIMTNVTLGICVSCPSNCNSCEYAVLSPAMSTPVLAINCTDCVSGFVNSYFNGSCQPCPQNCITCSCIMNDCSMTMCSECASGFSINHNTMTNQCQAQEGTRRLVEEFFSEVPQTYNWGSAVIGNSALAILVMALGLGLLLSKKWSRTQKSSCPDYSPCAVRDMMFRNQKPVR